MYKSKLDLRLVLVRADDLPKIKEGIAKSIYRVGQDEADL